MFVTKKSADSASSTTTSSSTSSLSTGGHNNEPALIEVFENGTLMGAVISEPAISDSILSNSVITLTSDMLNFNSSFHHQSDSNSSCAAFALLSQSAIGGSVSPSSELCVAADASRIDQSNNATSVNHASSNRNSNCNNNTSSISGILSQAECLNSSDTCSSSYETNTRSSGSNSKRSRRKLKKCRPAEIFVNPYPPPYATIYVDAAGNGQTTATAVLPANGFQNPIGSFGTGHLTVSVPVIRRRSISETETKKCCSGWLTRPSLPFVIGILALGGVACTLGGIVLGSTGLIEHSTQYLSAALLMIGIGVSMLVISGAIWRLSIPDDTDSFHCFRPSFDTCRNCNSPYCANRFLTGAFFYPEFQHRQPPPSYMTTLQEYRLLVPEEQTESVGDTQRNQSPPPSYRSFSTNSLSMAAVVAVDERRAVAIENETNENQTNEKQTDGS